MSGEIPVLAKEGAQPPLLIENLHAILYAPRVCVTLVETDLSQGGSAVWPEVVSNELYGRLDVFQINPLGTQRDALITNEQAGDTQDGDPGWDGVWTSEARITRDGWTATIAIPFSTLNFMQSRDVVPDIHTPYDFYERIYLNA